mmetsp:Transcript_42808/g.122087  ORF Transcript_42808/g.122087 Transcript_42808/m.122087 type:complete len:992 (+) Transcript_42808:55-3030(+)
MLAEPAIQQGAAAAGIGLTGNAFLLAHGWTAGALLLEFVSKVHGPLSTEPMTVAQLAEATGANEGPLAVLLRTCRILGYVSFDPATGAHALVPSTELRELLAFLGPETSTAETLRSVYSQAAPPFRLPSEQATHCLGAWTKERQHWEEAQSKLLPILLDGIILAPLLTSITYFARWSEEGLDMGKEGSMESFDFTQVDDDSRRLLSGIFKELGIGSLNSEGILHVSTKSSLALQRCYSFYVPTSYSPMLSHFGLMLMEDAGWGFLGVGQDTSETEVHVQRTLNVVGSGAQHKTFFKDMMRHIDAVFSGDKFDAQPKFVADTGCGDGHLLIQIYEHVRSCTARGQVLAEHPLTMIGIDFNEESRLATAVNLSKHGVPHLVLKGDIGKPAEIMASLRKLKKKRVDPAHLLHVRSFLDHDRPYIPPAAMPAAGSAEAAFAQEQLADVVHLDRHGRRLGPLEAFASLAEHMRRWAEALEGSFGICMLEVMILDVPTTKRFMRDSVSFHFDIVQCLSRQYMVSPCTFAFAGAMSGLFPRDYNCVQTYPEQERYCRVLSQHLVRRPFRVRLAELSDLEAIARLEELAWAEQLRSAPEVLRRRLETAPSTNLVCELDGQVVAALYMQRLGNIASVDSERFIQISDAHVPDGRVLQLVAIVADPDQKVRKLAVGSELRNFALHIARLDPSVDTVIGVTRCSAFTGGPCSHIQEYVDKHVAGKLADPILEFHSSCGAKIRRLVHGFRPEDIDNGGIGVLIEYRVKDAMAKNVARRSAARAAGPAEQEPAAEAPAAEVSSLSIISAIFEDLGHSLDPDDLGRGFFSYGLDSLELLRIRNRLISTIFVDLPTTLLLDFPNVQDLAQHLDVLRSAREEKPPLDDEAQDGPGTAWDALSADELLFIQQKCNKFYALPHVQGRLQEAKLANSERAGYLKAIEPILIEVEGPVFLANDVIDDTKVETVRRAREDMTKCIKKFSGVLEVQDEAKELLRLTHRGCSTE